jgi:hypothetical protein
LPTRKRSSIVRIYKAAAARFQGEFARYYKEIEPVQRNENGDIKMSKYVEMATILRACFTDRLNNDAEFAVLRRSLMLEIEGRWHHATIDADESRFDHGHHHFFQVLLQTRDILNGTTVLGVLDFHLKCPEYQLMCNHIADFSHT